MSDKQFTLRIITIILCFIAFIVFLNLASKERYDPKYFCTVQHGTVNLDNDGNNKSCSK